VAKQLYECRNGHSSASNFYLGGHPGNGYIDLSIENVAKTRKGYSVSLKNIGGYPAPVDLLMHYKDGTTDTQHLTPAIWQLNLKEATIPVVSKKDIQSVELKGGIFMDADLMNNTWKSQ